MKRGKFNRVSLWTKMSFLTTRYVGVAKLHCGDVTALIKSYDASDHFTRISLWLNSHLTQSLPLLRWMVMMSGPLSFLLRLVLARTLEVFDWIMLGLPKTQRKQLLGAECFLLISSSCCSLNRLGAFSAF